MTNLINSQVSDAVEFVNAQVIDSGPSGSAAMLDPAMTDALATMMYNAAAHQQQAQVLSNSNMVAACAKILSVPLGGVPAPSSNQNSAPNPEADPDSDAKSGDALNQEYQTAKSAVSAYNRDVTKAKNAYEKALSNMEDLEQTLSQDVKDLKGDDSDDTNNQPNPNGNDPDPVRTNGN